MRRLSRAPNPTAEGEATAIYVSKLLKPLGVPCDAELAWAFRGRGFGVCDEVTMMKRWRAEGAVEKKF